MLVRFPYLNTYSIIWVLSRDWFLILHKGKMFNLRSLYSFLFLLWFPEFKANNNKKITKKKTIKEKWKMQNKKRKYLNNCHQVVFYFIQKHCLLTFQSQVRCAASFVLPKEENPVLVKVIDRPLVTLNTVTCFFFLPIFHGWIPIPPTPTPISPTLNTRNRGQTYI